MQRRLESAGRLRSSDDLEERRADNDEEEEADHQRTERRALLLLRYLHLEREGRYVTLTVACEHVACRSLLLWPPAAACRVRLSSSPLSSRPVSSDLSSLVDVLLELLLAELGRNLLDRALSGAKKRWRRHQSEEGREVSDRQRADEPTRTGGGQRTRNDDKTRVERARHASMTVASRAAASPSAVCLFLLLHRRDATGHWLEGRETTRPVRRGARAINPTSRSPTRPRTILYCVCVCASVRASVVSCACVVCSGRGVAFVRVVVGGATLAAPSRPVSHRDRGVCACNDENRNKQGARRTWNKKGKVVKSKITHHGWCKYAF